MVVSVRNVDTIWPPLTMTTKYKVYTNEKNLHTIFSLRSSPFVAPYCMVNILNLRQHIVPLWSSEEK